VTVVLVALVFFTRFKCIHQTGIITPVRVTLTMVCFVYVQGYWIQLICSLFCYAI